MNLPWHKKMNKNEIINWVFSVIFGLLFLFFIVVIFVTLPVNLRIPIQYDFSILNCAAIVSVVGLSFIVMFITHRLIEYFSNNFGDITDIAFVGKTIPRPNGAPKSALLRFFIPISGFMIIFTPVFLQIISWSVRDEELAESLKLYVGLSLVLLLIILIIVKAVKNEKK